jgi:excisionase family DNA binding protein
MTNGDIKFIIREVAAELGLPSRNWLSSQECAQYLGFSEQHLCSLVRAGTAPPSVLISKRARRFARADVDQWIKNGGCNV